MLCLALICALLITFPVFAHAAGQYQPVGTLEVSEKFEQMFDSALLIDMDGDVVLFSKEPDRIFSPTGSAVHLMSAYVVAMEADWEREIPVIDAVNELSSSVRKIGMQSNGERWLIKDLVAAMMLHSAQDAALVLYDHVNSSEEEYALLMNRYAAALGMESTKYVGALGGYESGQETTVSDLALLCQAALEEEKLCSIITAASHDTVNGQTIKSRFDFMDNTHSRYDGRIKGIGEGSTANSGTNIMLHLQDGERNLLFVGFTEADDQRGSEDNAIEILDYFLENTIRLDVTEAVQPLLSASEVKVQDGSIVTPAMAAEHCIITAEKSAGEDIMSNQSAFRLGTLPQLSQAPTAGASIGNVTLLYGDVPVSPIPLLAGKVVQLAVQPQENDAQPSQDPVTESIALSMDIPVYSAEDWMGTQREKDFLDQYGFYIITVAVILLAAIVLLAAHAIRRKKQ